MEVFGVPGTWMVQGGAVGLLAMLTVMVFLGRLVPLRSHRRELDREIRRGDEYKAAWEAELVRSATMAAQLGEIMSILRPQERR